MIIKKHFFYRKAAKAYLTRLKKEHQFAWLISGPLTGEYGLYIFSTDVYPHAHNPF